MESPRRQGGWRLDAAGTGEYQPRIWVCPSDAELTNYSSGLLKAEERARLEIHLDGCAECRAVVAVLAQAKAPQLKGSDADPDVAKVAGLERLGEHYVVDGVLGSGGMGIVLSAHHEILGHAVAVKVLRPTLAQHPLAEQRFLREARAGARLTSNHIARVLDAGRGSTGLPYLVMEQLEGMDGERFLSAHGVPPLQDVLDLIAQVLTALDEAHRFGLVHRDLKPANLFVRRLSSGRLNVKVLDFGLAKALDGEVGLTASHGFIGSPLYIAPEQLRSSADVDARADIWGIGCLLYRFLTGRVPFPADSIAEVVTRIQRDEPKAVKELRPDVPAELDALIRATLEKNRLNRPASVKEVGLRLRPLVSGPAAFELEQMLGVRSQGGAVPSRRPRAPWVAAATACVGLAAGYLVGTWRFSVPASSPAVIPIATNDGPVTDEGVEPSPQVDVLLDEFDDSAPGKPSQQPSTQGTKPELQAARPLPNKPRARLKSVGLPKEVPEPQSTDAGVPPRGVFDDRE